MAVDVRSAFLALISTWIVLLSYRAFALRFEKTHWGKMMHNAKIGDRVRVKCLRLPIAGVESPKPRKAKTFEFTVGSREVTPGLSSGVAGMAPGDRRRLTLQPQDAFGPVLPCLIREIPRRRQSARLSLQVGKWLTHLEPISGHRERMRVVEIKDDFLVVDGNHPLAGAVIDLDVMLISVDPSAHANQSRQQFEMGGES
jgi:FKBP-type peptidyl-prolyl cis-trans isomerase 2